MSNYEKKSNKKIIIVTECHRRFSIDAHEVIDHRSKHYAENDSDTTYDEEYQYLINEEYEIKDWLFGNMDWYECKSLVELPVIKRELSTLDIMDYAVVDG